MGHSTVSLIKKGYFDFNESLKILDEKKSQDRREYGYSENPDSFAHASSPSTKHSHLVFKESRAKEIIDKISSYETILIYYVKDSDWDRMFSDKKILRKKTRILNLLEIQNKKLSSLSSEYWERLDMNNKNTNPVFLKMDCCGSKINIKSLVSNRGQFQSICPVCSKQEPLLGDKLRQKLYGRLYLSKKNKIESKILSLKNEILELKKKDKDSISLTEFLKMSKKNENLINTGIFADVHH